MNKSVSPIVLISGGSRGLGKGLVKHFLDKSCRVATFSRNKTEAINDFEQIYPGRFFYESVETDSKLKVNSFVEKIEKKFGGIDILINNAAIASQGVFPVFPESEIDRVIDTNLKGTLFLTRAVSRIMLRRKSGRIINVVSIVGIRGFSGLSVYSASKAALIGFTSSLARELGPKNILVNAIAPGYIETEMSDNLTASQRAQIIRRTPLNRLGEIKDIVPVIDFLSSEASNFITGQLIVADGGITC